MTQYDAIASDYARIKKSNPTDRYCFYPRFYESVGDVRGLYVLDLATGFGKVAIEMAARHAREVIAVDESEAMLKIARALTPKRAPVSYHAAKVGELGRIGRFDIITGGWILHYAHSPEELIRMCKDIRVNLKRGGKFVALNANPSQPLGGTIEHGYTITAKSEPRNGDPMTVTIFADGQQTSFEIRHWDSATYQDAMKSAGLELEIMVPKPTVEGIEVMGTEYWDEILARPTTAIFCAT